MIGLILIEEELIGFIVRTIIGQVGHGFPILNNFITINILGFGQILWAIKLRTCFFPESIYFEHIFNYIKEMLTRINFKVFSLF